MKLQIVHQSISIKYQTQVSCDWFHQLFLEDAKLIKENYSGDRFHLKGTFMATGMEVQGENLNSEDVNK